MIYKWFILLFPIFTFVMALILYHCRGRKMTRFYCAMVERKTLRKFYINAILFVLIAFHYIYTLVNLREYVVFLSIILIISLYRFKTAEWLLQALNKNDRNFKIVGLVAVFLALVVSPHFLPLSATMIILMSASVLYPSAIVMQKYDSCEGLCGEEELYKYYFSLGHKNVQTNVQSREEEKDKDV